MIINDTAVIAAALPIIREFEGFKPKAYLCPSGIPTIGYGTTVYPNGHSVQLSDQEITRKEGESYLCHDAAQKLNAIQNAWAREPTINQAAAMLSLSYNIGVVALRSSTVVRRFNDGDIKGAADAFLMWDKINDHGRLVVSDGLKHRRQAERALFLS